MASALSASEIDKAMRELPAWQYVDGKVTRDYRFANFSEAFAFLTRVALLAEKRDHHPDIFNSWSRVTLSLTSHDAGGVTQRDIDLARGIDALGEG